MIMSIIISIIRGEIPRSQWDADGELAEYSNWYYRWTNIYSNKR